MSASVLSQLFSIDYELGFCARDIIQLLKLDLTEILNVKRCRFHISKQNGGVAAMSITNNVDTHSRVWSFDKLHEFSNYRIWHQKMMFEFQYEDFLHLFEEEKSIMLDQIEKKMSDPTVEDDTSLQSRSLMREERKKIQKNIEIWKRHNQRAISILYNKVEEFIEQFIVSCKTIVEVMRILKKQYLDTSFTAKHIARQKLLQITLNSCKNDVKKYIRQLSACKDEQIALNCEFLEWWIVSCLIANLKDRFKDFVQRVVLLKFLLKFDSIVAQLREMNRIQKRENEIQAHRAQFRKEAQMKEKKKKKEKEKKNFKKRSKCFVCKTYHFDVKC